MSVFYEIRKSQSGAKSTVAKLTKEVIDSLTGRTIKNIFSITVSDEGAVTAKRASTPEIPTGTARRVEINDMSSDDFAAYAKELDHVRAVLAKIHDNQN